MILTCCKCASECTKIVHLELFWYWAIIVALAIIVGATIVITTVINNRHEINITNLRNNN